MCRVAYAETIIAITRHVGYHLMSSFPERKLLFCIYELYC